MYVLTQEVSRVRIGGDDAHVLPQRPRRPLVQHGVAATGGGAVGDPEALAHRLVGVEVGVPGWMRQVSTESSKKS